MRLLGYVLVFPEVLEFDHVTVHELKKMRGLIEISRICICICYGSCSSIQRDKVQESS